MAAPRRRGIVGLLKSRGAFSGRAPLVKPPGRAPVGKPPGRTPSLAGTSASARRAEELLGEIALRKARIADDFYAIGVALRELARPQLHTALGHRTFEELLAARRPVGRVTAMKLMAVAEAFPKDQAVTLGVEKAYALVRYTAATPASDLARALVSSNARIDGRPLADLTAGDIAKAARRLKSGGAAPPRELASARQAARTLQRSLRKAGLKAAAVHATFEAGAFWLSVKLPLKDAARLAVQA